MNPQQNQQPQMIMPNQPMPGQRMPGQTMGQQAPGQMMSGQQMSEQMMSQMAGQPMMNQQMMPGQMMPGRAVAGQPMPGQMMPGQPMANQQMMNQQQAMFGRGVAGIGSVAMQAQATNPSSPNKEVPTSTQATILISELRDNVVIMKDGSFRAVVACKSINFDLMSDMERESVEFAYQNFLNSLNFSVQVLIRSQRVDIGPYIERLSEIRRNNDNMLLGVLMDDYINFIDILSQEANIMDKSFFIVVPYYSSPEMEKDMQATKNFFKVFSRANNTGVTRIDRLTYDKAMSELAGRVDLVMSGLFQMGIQSVRLNTKELAQLYYNFNNPDTAVREPLVDFSNVATMYVRKGEKGNHE